MKVTVYDLRTKLFNDKIIANIMIRVICKKLNVKNLYNCTIDVGGE